MTDTQEKNIITEPKHPQTAPKKIITLTLAYFINSYKVVSISNSTYYRPGEWMSVEVAQDCCNIDNWQVVMADNQFIQSLIGVAAGAITGSLASKVI